MNDLTRVLNAAAAGEAEVPPGAFDAIHRELRRMAAGKLAGEASGHTLQPTALVHEAYIRLCGGDARWQNRRHFYGAASEAMRRILVESARRRAAAKRGGGQPATVFDEQVHSPDPAADERLLQVHEALDALEAADPLKAQVVKLRFFVGLDHHEIAALLDLSERTVRRHWELAKVWLYRAIRDGG